MPSGKGRIGVLGLDYQLGIKTKNAIDLTRWRLIAFNFFEWARLPRGSHWIDTELLRVTWPHWCSSESTTTRTRCTSPTKLGIDRSHGVLRNTPGIVLLHGDVRWDDQSCRLSRLKIVIAPMPRLGLRMVSRPGIAMRRWMKPPTPYSILSRCIATNRNNKRKNG